MESHLSQLAATSRAQLLLLISESQRYANPRCLVRHGYRSFSQNEEDGIIDEIFRRIGTESRVFIEFGVGDGLQNNTLALLLAGWRGLWIEGDVDFQASIEARFSEAIGRGQLILAKQLVTAENIEALLGAAGLPTSPDLLSIDIDGNDYWVWKAIQRTRPRVVVIEYNASLGRTARATFPYDPSYHWDGSIRFGASLGAMEDLGREKGYLLVGCSLTGVNAFFVRKDCVGDHFLPPYTAEHHYEPPRYGPNGTGHYPGWVHFEPTTPPEWASPATVPTTPLQG